MSQKKENIFLIDGSSFCYRAFYAIQDLKTSRGFPTNAIYGVVNMLNKLIKEQSPDMLAVVFDLKGPTVRHKKFEEYKIQRKPMPDDLSAQMPRIKEVLSAYNIPIYELKGFEADDIIATLACKAVDQSFGVFIVTGDKDAFQLVDGEIKVLSPHLKESKIYDAGAIKEKYGVGPEGMVELMALMGDSIDNIPGVEGIGEVTARKLIQKYGSVDDVYRNIEKIESKALREKLERGKDMAFLSRELVILDRNLPVELDVKSMHLKEPDKMKLAKLFEEFEFRKLLLEIGPAKETKPVECLLCKTAEELGKLSAVIVKSKVLAFSVDKNVVKDRLQGIALSWDGGKACYIQMDTGLEEKMEILGSIFSSEKVLKVGYDVKDGLRTLCKYQIKAVNMGFDVMIADYLLEPSLSKRDLTSAAMRYLGYTVSLEEGLSQSWDEEGQGKIDFSRTNLYDLFSRRSEAIFRLHGVLKEKLEEKKLYDLFKDVEMPLVEVLLDMEEEGIGIDIKYVKKMSDKIEDQIDEVTGKIYKLAGERFNINSPKQLATVLFERLALPSVKKTKTGTSTDESVLSKLSKLHQLPAAVLAYRTLNKVKTTYYDSILEMVDESTGRLHTSFNQTVTATGRLSSSEPNLQNIPVKTDIGREIRRAFVAGGKDKVLLAADYSQIELRILAHLSKDKNLMKAFKDKEDVHLATASLIFNTPVGEVTEKMRAIAKTVNFGIIYGMSSFGLAKDLDISGEEAQSFIDSYFERYSGVKDFIDRTIESARKNGYVTTILNRRRYLPEINGRDVHMRNFAERAAINTPVQGSAADLIKIAMLECYKETRGSAVKMILQVHDELIFTLPEDELAKTAKKIKKLMENVMELDVPLVISVEAGKNWMDLDEVAISG